MSWKRSGATGKARDEHEREWCGSVGPHQGSVIEQMHGAVLALVDIWGCTEAHASASMLQRVLLEGGATETTCPQSLVSEPGRRPAISEPEGPGVWPGSADMAGPGLPLVFSFFQIRIYLHLSSFWVHPWSRNVLSSARASALSGVQTGIHSSAGRCYDIRRTCKTGLCYGMNQWHLWDRHEANVKFYPLVMNSGLHFPLLWFFSLFYSPYMFYLILFNYDLNF